MGCSHLNIKKVQVLKTVQLTNTTFVDGKGIMLKYWRPWESLPIVGNATYTVTPTVENNTVTYEHTVSAWMDEPYEEGNFSHAVLLTTVEGDEYEIGTQEQPYCIFTCEASMPGEDSGRCGYQLTIKYRSPLGLLKVID